MWVRVAGECIAFSAAVCAACFAARGPVRRRLLVPCGIAAQRGPRVAVEAALSLGAAALHFLVGAGIAGLLTPAALRLLWRAALSALVLLLVVAVPAAHASSFVAAFAASSSSAAAAAFAKPRTRALTVTGAVLVWLLCAWKCLGRFADGGGDSVFAPGAWVARIAAVGVPVIAALSGNGAVATPHRLILTVIRPVQDAALAQAERQLRDNAAFIEAKREKLRSLSSSGGSSNGNGGSSGSFGFLSSLVGRGRAAAHDSLVQETLHDIEALETFGRELRAELCALQQQRQRQEQSKTLRGRLGNYAGYGMAAFCIYRVLSALANVLRGRRGDVDPVTRGLGIFLRFFALGDAEFWAQQCSLAFAGTLAALSLRGLLINMRKALGDLGKPEEERLTLLSGVRRAAPSRLAAGQLHTHLALCTAQLIGAYFLSSVLLMRKNLPAAYRQPITDAIGDLHFDTYHQWFDVVFLVSALGTAATLAYREVSAISRRRRL